MFGFNCGFGNFENPMPKKFDLLLSWISDLFFLTGTQLPLFFTCANHYADVSGEISIMYHILGASLILLPQENPFSFASTLIPPKTKWASKGEEPTEFSRGNSYFYGVQYCDKLRRKRINVNIEEKSRILGSLINYLTQKIDLSQLTESLVLPQFNSSWPKLYQMQFLAAGTQTTKNWEFPLTRSLVVDKLEKRG